MYKKDKFGKSFEYRDKLEKLEGQLVKFTCDFDKIHQKENFYNTNIMIHNIFFVENCRFCCNHVILCMQGNNKKRQKMLEQFKDMKKGDKFTFLAKVYKYSTKNNSRENYGLKIIEIL